MTCVCRTRLLGGRLLLQIQTPSYIIHTLVLDNEHRLTVLQNTNTHAHPMKFAPRRSLEERFSRAFSHAKPRGGKISQPHGVPAIPSRRRERSPAMSNSVDDNANSGQGLGSATQDGSADEEQDQLADDSNEQGANEYSEEDMAENVAGAMGKTL